MAETINFKKRLIGKEDINFDITGTNEQENFFTSDGGAKQLTKLNASHIPLLQETRSKVNAANVDNALIKLTEKVDNFEASDVLGEDLTINFLPEDDTETIQLKINQQKKNLNGHTLTFLFPASLQQNLYQSLEWNDFYNGTVVIAGGREDSRIAIYDNLDINSLFRIYRCQCEVIIRYFYFVHQYSPYAISAESSSAVIVEKCNFAGIKGVESYAVNMVASNALLVDCELNDDKNYYPENNDGIGKHLGEIFAYPGAVPPEGAYLLNGQTITGCNELYPKFWEWLVENAGEMIATPVYKAWTMPALTADGTLGGAEYAAQASGAMASGHDAYKSFDGTHGASSSYAGIAGVKSGWLTWYSPVKLKFTQVFFRNQTSGSAYTNRMASFAIYGSNDNAAWTELVSGAYNSTANSAEQMVEIPESKFNADTPGYHYLKIEAVNGGGSNTDFPEITIYGQEYLYTDYAGSGNILTLSDEAYEYTLARTGVCGGFVIDTVAGSVRLPKWHYQSPLGETLPVRGNGMTLGVTDGSISAGIVWSTASSVYRLTVGDEGYGATLPFSGTRTPVIKTNSFIGVTTDPDNSGIVAENNAPVDHFVWCIQVFNAATALSEQESAQLASQMQMKAQTDLANVTENLDFIVKHEEAADGSWWYDLYRSGKVEQGGTVTAARGALATNCSTIISFPVEFANTNYFAIGIPTSKDFNTADATVTIESKDNENFTVYVYDTNAGDVKLDWFAIGKAATE